MIANKSENDVDTFFNDLDADELETLLRFVARVDPLEMTDGKPKYISDEIDLIQKFQEFVGDDVEEDEEEDGDLDEEDEPASVSVA